MGTNKELLVNTLMIEYQNIHERVFAAIKRFEGSTVKVLSVIGVLLFFCFQRYDSAETSARLIINLTVFIAIPLLSFATIALARSHIDEIIFFGNYLKIIENKVNKIVEDDLKTYGFDNNRLIDWEYWRRFHGYQKKGKMLINNTFGFISVTLVFIAYLLSVFVRLVNLFNNDVYEFKIYLIISVVLLFIILCFVLQSTFAAFKRRRKQSIDYMKTSVLYKDIDA